MKLYYDLDKKELVPPPGTGGAIRSYSFTRGDETPLELHVMKDGEDVTDVTDIVFIIKATPGIGVTSLAQATTWENPAETTYFTALLNLNGEDLDDLLGELKTKALLCQVCCHYNGEGPITSQLVTANVGGDLYRGDEGTPLELPTPDEWLEARRPAPLELSAPPDDEIHQVLELQFDATVPIANGNVTVTLTSADVTGGTPLVFTAAVTLGMDFSAMYAAIYAAIGAQSLITDKFTLDIINGIHLTRIARGNDGTLGIVVTDPDTVLDNSPLTGTILTDGVTGTDADALGQLAIVSTSNDSGDFEDVWTCSNLSPFTWQPPGQITRAPNRTLYRAIVDNSGIPSTELAYP